MKRFLYFAAAAAMLLAAACNRYEKVVGDPLDTRIYTLDNGLKVYMTVNKETPRIQPYIAVRSGGKNDPADQQLAPRTFDQTDDNQRHEPDHRADIRNQVPESCQHTDHQRIRNSAQDHGNGSDNSHQQGVKELPADIT